jgi:hypothetical protein
MTRRERIGELVGAVARQALADRGVARVALLDDGSPEARLCAELLEAALGPERLVRVAGPPDLEPVLQTPPPGVAAERLAEELRRLHARLMGDVLPACPLNKTALLLAGPLPPEPFLPLGDVYASQVAELAGGWSAPPTVARLAERAGGVERLDEVLRARLEGRDAQAIRRLPAEAAAEVEAALRRGAADRVTLRLVPKIGSRTIGVDLFE